MDYPPRRVNEPVFTRRFTINVTLLGVLICVGTLALFYYGVVNGKAMGMPEPANYRYATTFAFMTVTFFENWNIFASRSLTNSIFGIKKRNKYMYLALVVAIILQFTVVYIPALQDVFHTYPLGLLDWVLIIVVSSSIIWVTEGFKYFWKWWDRNHPFKNI